MNTHTAYLIGLLFGAEIGASIMLLVVMKLGLFNNVSTNKIGAKNEKYR